MLRVWVRGVGGVDRAEGMVRVRPAAPVARKDSALQPEVRRREN